VKNMKLAYILSVMTVLALIVINVDIPISRAEIPEAQPIQFNQFIVGACYPWLVLEHQIINMPTGMVYPGVGGDSALAVYCGNEYFAVKGANGIYIFRMDTGSMYRMVSITSNSSFIGFKHDNVGVYDAINNVVYVLDVKSGIDTPIKVSNATLQMDFDIINGIPVVVYVANVNNSNVYYVATPGSTLVLPYSGRSISIYGDTIYLEDNGLRVLKITLTPQISVREIDYIPVPFPITRIEGLMSGRYLVLSSNGVKVLFDISSKTLKYLGIVMITPIGYYIPQATTTYVILNDRLEPVPGYATVLFGDLGAFTNIINEDGSVVPFLYGFRTSILITNTPISGALYSGNYVLAVNLPAGTYKLPRSAVLKIGTDSIVLDKDITTYPQVSQSTPTPITTSSVKYYTVNFPSNYVPIDRVENAKGIYVGAERAIVITNTEAIIYNTFGISARIPGTWKYAGIGSCVVLYDGSNLRLYDFAGNPITNYVYPIPAPDFMTCGKVNGAYYVELYSYNVKTVIAPDGVKTEYISTPTYVDAVSQLTLVKSDPPLLTIGGFTYGLPSSSFDIRINGYVASWRDEDKLYVLSIKDSAVYVALNVPTSKTFYPMGDYVFMLDRDTGILEILPYKSWFISGCSITVNTDNDATVIVNGKAVGVGTTTVYVPCDATVNVTVSKQYYRSVSKQVIVNKPIYLDLHPEPIISNVVLNVITPRNLTVSTVVLRIDNDIVVWNVGTTKQFLSKPYNISVIEFRPLDVCVHYDFSKTFVEGSDTLNIECQLTVPVLALYSNVSANVKIFRSGMDIENDVPLYLITVEPETISYTTLTPGEYVIVSEPLVQGYVRNIINVTITTIKVIPIDVTPLKFGHLSVVSTVSSASIVVYDENGAVVAQGTGTLDADLAPGTYSVSVSASGYKPFYTSVQLNAGEEQDVTAVLVPIEIVTTTPPPSMWQTSTFQIGLIIAGVLAAVVIALLLRRRKRAGVIGEEVGGA